MFDPEETLELLMDEEISARAKVLILLLSFSPDGAGISQEELSKTLRASSTSEVTKNTIEEAERAGFITVDRTKKPYWYQVTR